MLERGGGTHRQAPQDPDDAKRGENAEAVISGRKTAAQAARTFAVSPRQYRASSPSWGSVSPPL